MRLVYVLLAMTSLVIVGGLGGCATPASVNLMGNKNSSSIGTPAVGSKFSKLTKGMSKKKVVSRIGEAKHCAGKQEFIDNTLFITLECIYKNEGTLVYDGNPDSNKLISIKVNADAD